MVVNRNGDRRVIVGPQTYLLEYDETLQVMELSTGTPKSDDKLYRTVYLRVLNNKVSDAVEAETRDLCRVHLHLSYRVNFEGDGNRWFNSENYVRLLTDHLRSLIRHAVKQYGVEEFYARSVSILRDVILGPQVEGGKRPGRFFEENGMRVYDVEVLDVTLGDEAIAGMLVEAQHAAVRQALTVAAERRKLDLARETEATRQQIQELESATRIASLAQRLRELEQAARVQTAEVTQEAELKRLRQAAEQAAQATLDAIHQAELSRRGAASKLDLEVSRAEMEQRMAELQAEVRAVVEKAQAVSPDLVAALQAFSDRALAEKMAQSMAPLAILGGESVAEVLARLLKGTPLANALPAVAKASGG
jgi:major vault protein